MINTDYTKVLLEVKKVIDEDAKPIDAMMDTVTRMSNIPSSYFTFLEKEAGKLNELAQHHRGEINPSCFNDFYSEMMSYYKSKTALYIILCKCRIRDSEMSLVFSLLLNL